MSSPLVQKTLQGENDPKSEKREDAPEGVHNARSSLLFSVGKNFLERYKELGWTLHIRLFQHSERTREFIFKGERQGDIAEYCAVAKFIGFEEESQNGVAASLISEIGTIGSDRQQIQGVMLVDIVELVENRHHRIPFTVGLQRLDRCDCSRRHSLQLATLQSSLEGGFIQGDRELVAVTGSVAVCKNKLPDKVVQRTSAAIQKVASGGSNLEVGLRLDADALDEPLSLLIALDDKGALAFCCGATEHFHITKVLLCAPEFMPNSIEHDGVRQQVIDPVHDLSPMDGDTRRVPTARLARRVPQLHTRNATAAVAQGGAA